MKEKLFNSLFFLGRELDSEITKIVKVTFSIPNTGVTPC